MRYNHERLEMVGPVAAGSLSGGIQGAQGLLRLAATSNLFIFMRIYLAIILFCMAVAGCMAGEILVKTNIAGLGQLAVEKSEIKPSEVQFIEQGKVLKSVPGGAALNERVTVSVVASGMQNKVWQYTFQRRPSAKYGMIEPDKGLESSFNIMDMQYDTNHGTLVLVWNMQNTVHATVIKAPPFPGQVKIQEQFAGIPVQYSSVKECRAKYIGDVPAVEFILKDATRTIYMQADRGWRQDKLAGR